MKRALVLANGPRIQYRVLRCAGECFDEVYVLGANDAYLLKRSRFCEIFIDFIGDFANIRQSDLADIRRLCAVHKIDMVLPSCSRTTRLLAAHGAEIGAPYYPVPDQHTFDALDDKWRFAGVCADLDLPVPLTRRFETMADLRRDPDLARFGFPLILKPAAMSGGYGVRRIDSAEELPEHLNYAPIICQAYVPGEELSAFYLCEAGKIFASFSYRRTLTKLEEIRVPDIDAHASRLVAHFRYDGVIGFDIRRRPDGEIAFIECNPRFWYHMEVAMLAGLNFVTLGCRLRQGEGGPAASDTLKLRSPRRLCGNLLTPWRLNRAERAYLRYIVRDPAISGWAAFQSAIGRYRLAGGQLL
ncbi:MULTISPECIES: ATP-grasp domain-containing protein [Methylorubrum]|uniref:ATP-grasp domain-containing protein n=1 Tax=Methylorubrum TaxID=2282523 RepID=UPI00209F0E04|nr:MULTISPECIES: ATP-grasp domain-containing protein [Methylorubrum]MCP1551397.1 biotin carboxylase [Methylorubrum zatmanii]MCP1551987.1 biotin carboxylase [Methylorubrum extorquens]MCP1581702.1 biotin carboxylase [Methylorubrum extorquens]